MILKFIVTGMTCAACSARVEKVTGEVQGVEKAEVNLLAGKMTVYADTADVKEGIIAAVEAAGYGISMLGEAKKSQDNTKPQTDKSMLNRIIGSGVFLLILMYFTMGHMLGLPVPAWYHGQGNALVAALLQLFLTLPAVYLNRVYYSNGIKALCNRAPNMDSLIAVGSGAALIYGVVALFRMAFAMGHGDWQIVKTYSENLYFESAAMILTLITLGKYLETRAKRKTGDALKALMDLSPQTATVRADGMEKEVPIEDVNVGDTVILRSGSKVPVDGTIISGRAAVDQSALTGESVPVEKTVGDTVPTAAIITEGYLEIRADKVGEDTSLAQIIRMVEEAGGSKAPIARLADKIAGVFVPVVMLIAAAAFAVWMLAGQTLEFSLTTAIAVLVISCPCALGLATPVAIMVGTGTAARLGILFKDAESLENLHRVDAVVLDKTGTLTTGKPAVTDVIPGKLNAEELLRVAAAIEKKSEHPFAKAIMDKVGNLTYPEANFFETLPGQGVSGIIDNTRYYGGNLQLMRALNVTVPDCSYMAAEGKTPLYFATADGEFLGTIAAADVLRDDSADAIAALRDLKLDLVMLTGDNETTARAIAQKAGISQVIANVLPWNKAAAVEELRRQGKNVLMVGDGINDAPALAAADVGMAIGAGTDVAIDSADVVLMESSLTGICRAIELSRATIRNIRQNLFWAFFYNCLGIPIAAGVLYPAFQIQLSPMLGAAAMSFSSVFVVSNALRLRLFQPKVRIQKTEVIDVQEEKSMETIIKVEGMMCSHCKARVENVCKEVAGVTDAVVDLQEKQVTVTGTASVDVLKKAITEAGYQVIV